jgi:hypothetical protein
MFLLVLALASCATDPLPRDYSGPTASIEDFGRYEDDSRAVMYFVSEVNGKRISESLSATRNRNRGRGFQMDLYIVTRAVPAEKIKLKLEGRTMYATPIQELWNSGSMLSVSQVIELDAQQGAQYIVNGVLQEKGSAVWLEDKKTKEKVGVPVAVR